jgi:hypothetical protein
MLLKRGDKVKLNQFKQRFTVQAASENFAILTKPFNLKKTYSYTILDFRKNLRNRDNQVFGFWEDYDNKEGATIALDALEKGEIEISHKGPLPIDIEKIYHGGI